MTNYIGYLAAFLTTFSFLPQALKTIKTKNTDSISLLMYLMFVSGVFMWLLYGIIIKDIPLILANIITFILSSSILLIKLKNFRKK